MNRHAMMFRTVASWTSQYSRLRSTRHCQNSRMDDGSCRFLLLSNNSFATTTSSSATTKSLSESPRSGRSSFKSIPVQKSLLNYIEQVGVGRKPKLQNRAKKRRSRAGFREAYDAEDQFFRIQNLSQQSRRRRGVEPRPSPPPPFGGYSTDSNAKEDSQYPKRRIRRFPVKVIGRVGSDESEFPRPSKGLPEVAIAGRSNVGKSTLLNALLYGNNQHVDSSKNRSKSRRRMPSTPAKLAKGVKAITSDKPGETRYLTFYQLSAKIETAGEEIETYDSYKTSGNDESNYSSGSSNTVVSQSSSSSRSNRISLLLVDLPGYGFAYSSPEQARQWQSLMESYILQRGKSLKRVLLLIDARHGMKKVDIDFLESLQTSIHMNQQSSRESTKSHDGYPQNKCTKMVRTSDEVLSMKMCIISDFFRHFVYFCATGQCVRL